MGNDGTVFIGNYVDGVRCGKGVTRLKKQRVCLEEWKDGKKHEEETSVPVIDAAAEGGWQSRENEREWGAKGESSSLSFGV